MPPKKNKEGKAKKLPPVILDDVDTTELTLKKLQTYAIQIQEEIIRQKNQATFFQIEKDKLRAFWEVSSQQLKDIRWQIRTRDKDIDDALEKRRKDVKIARQKLKHILHENHENITESKYFTFVELIEKRNDFNSQINEIINDIELIKQKLIEEDLEHKSQVRSLQIENAADVSKVRDLHIVHLGELETKYDKQFNNTINKIQAKQSEELNELENRKEKQINDLILSNKKFIDQVKHYYNNLIDHNLKVMDLMKESNDTMKNKLAATDKQLREAKLDNQNLKIPIERGTREIKYFKDQLEFYERDKEELKQCIQTLNKLTTKKENLEWENEAASLIMQRKQQENQELQHNLLVKTLEIQMKDTNQNILLERIIKQLLTGIECVYTAIEAHGNLVGKQILDDLENTVGFSKDVKEDLLYEISIVSKAFHNVLNTYRYKMQEHSIHLDELGFTQLALKEIGSIKKNYSVGLIHYS